MNLSDLRPAKGSNKKRFKKGRGPGSGIGKTCGRGQKGAGARKSSGQGSAFEGGQQPVQRRMPKVGFRSHFPRDTQIVNVKDLEKHCEGTVTAKELAEFGLIKHVDKPVKILGEGALAKALQVKVHKYSASARKSIEAAGGKAEVI